MRHLAPLLLLLAPSLAIAQTPSLHGTPKASTEQVRPEPAQLALVAPQSAAPVLALPAATAAKLLAEGRATVLDVRTPAEFATGHLAGARNVDFRAPDFAQQVARLDKSKTYLLYCASGRRSGQAAGLMKQQGFRSVSNAGGYQELKAAGAK